MNRRERRSMTSQPCQLGLCQQSLLRLFRLIYVAWPNLHSTHTPAWMRCGLLLCFPGQGSGVPMCYLHDHNPNNVDYGMKQLSRNVEISSLPLKLLKRLHPCLCDSEELHQGMDLRNRLEESSGCYIVLSAITQYKHDQGFVPTSQRGKQIRIMLTPQSHGILICILMTMAPTLVISVLRERKPEGFYCNQTVIRQN